MSPIPILLTAALLILAVALCIHCLLLHRDKTPPIEPTCDSDSASRRAAH